MNARMNLMTGASPETGSRKSWLNYVVRVALGPNRYSVEFRDGLAKLRHIEAWLHENHLPLSLTDIYGQPRSEMVTVFFDASDAAKALAFRGLCGELGIVSSLKSQQVVLNDHHRVTLGGARHMAGY